MSRREINPAIRVLVVDDSAFMRAALSRMIETDAALYVCGTAHTGMEALHQIALLKPDVVTLDVEMPGWNGLETLKRILRECPVPVIMVSSLTSEGAETTLDALHLGAFDCVAKQNTLLSADTDRIRDELVAKIHTAVESCRRRPMGRAAATCATVLHPHTPPAIVAIGVSTGGPRALQEILPALPPDLPAPVLVVQHMPKGFTKPLANRLSHLCRVKVREAEHDEPVEPGVVYIAPAGLHMTLHRATANVAINLCTSPERTPHIPSVDVTMLSVADVFQNLSMGIIMTGMGADGAQGMRAIFQAGGLTIGQDEATCAVYGMPRACAEMGVLHRVVGLHHIPHQIMQAIGCRKRA